MSSTAARPLWAGRALALVGIVLFAFSLRSAVASLSPVIDHIDRDFALAPAIVGLIGTAPPVCYAIFGLLTPQLERRFGLERLAVVAMAVVAAGLIARGFSPSALTLLGSTALIFAAVGVGNVLLPPLVRAYFPDRVGLVTTLYSTLLAVSTFFPALVAVPVADSVGWRWSLAMWAVFALAAMIPWITLLARVQDAGDGRLEGANPAVFGRMWRIPLAWALVATFAACGTVAYVSFAWLPQILVQIAGVTPAEAGVLLSLFAAMGLPASLTVPILVTRFTATKALFAVAVASGLVALAGLLFAPATVTWLWVALLGLFTLLFPLTLVLLGLRARTHEGSVALSGFVQSIGYGIVAIFPVSIGILHDATGAWTVPLIVLALVVVVAIPAGFVVARGRTVEDEWESRHGKW